MIRFHREGTSFLMTDIQERLLPAIDRPETIVRNAVRLLKTAGVLSLPVLYTEQYPKGLGATVGEILSALPVGTPRFEKAAFSCCDEPGFFEAFEAAGPHPVTVVFGVETHICILSTVQDLLDRGGKVVLAVDACGSRARENHDLAVEAARACGALTVPTETVVYQLLGKAGSPEFKSLLPLFK